ncbi:hypothetical protein C5469_16225 [Photorhabdus cinerea]|uniref:Uncharacterized protein n=1 Tax=Photorhabdus cinerea TaxID=471575 RepID=A0A7X5TI88_9GAMM|nr:hypothetical protein [Photorhabdus cinerea]
MYNKDKGRSAMNIMIKNFHTGNGDGHTTYVMNIVKYGGVDKGASRNIASNIPSGCLPPPPKLKA